MRDARIKWLLIAALLVAIVLGLASCFIKPDKTEEVQPTEPVMVLPFETVSPTAPAISTDQSGWEGSDGTAGPGASQGPSATQTIGIITPSPSPVPSATKTPSPTAQPTATDDGTLRNGSEGQAVKNVQQRLKELGYYTGSVDGVFGSGTEQAVRSFQSVNGLNVDGVVGSRTLSKLNSSSAIKKPKATAKPTAKPNVYATNRPTPKSYTPSELNKYRYLQLGSSGSDVTRLQNRLKELGYFNGTVNGYFGEDTKAAVEAFQKRNGEWVDGVAGEDTQTTLFSDQALPYSGSSSEKASNVVASSATSSAVRTLRSGMSGDDVKALQTRLQELYYYTGKATGTYDATTELAVKVFQQKNNLQVDGVAGSTTLSLIYSASALYGPTLAPSPTAFVASGTLQSGSMGEEVYRLQERLYDLGYYNGKIDGIYSDQVAVAVRSFQSASGLTADGKAGSGTQRKLYADGAVAAENADDSFATLKQGDEGERVRALQSLLATYGYYTDPVDGKYGAATVLAVQQFQGTNGLTVDGVAGPHMQQVLYGEPRYATVASAGDGAETIGFETLRQGDESLDVLRMQEFLQESGYYTGEVDGSFGATTLVAVQAFQSRNDLTASGVADNETLALLYSGSAVPQEGYVQSADEYNETLYAQLQGGAAQTPDRTSMKEGDEGQDVMNLQQRLATLGYFTEELTGRYGSTTTAAVSAFQQNNGLEADGKAGPQTQAKLYALDVVGASKIEGDLAVLSNQTRELEEQNLTGAIQGSLAGGGVAASYNSRVYYTGKGGALYMKRSSGDTKLYDGAAGFIHASSRGITFVSGNKIMRMPAEGGTAQTLVSAGNIRKLSIVGDRLFYLEGNTLIKANSAGEMETFATGVNDFTLDAYQMTLYLATDSGVKSIGVTGYNETLLLSEAVDQIQICDSVLFFRKDGAIYRMEDGVNIQLMDMNISWMAIYRNKIYYLLGDRLYRCDTNGQNSQVFYEETAVNVSFVAGYAYITAKQGGPVVATLPVE